MHNQTESRRNFFEIPSPKFTNCSMRVRLPLCGPKSPVFLESRGWPIFETCRIALTGKSEIKSSPTRFHEAREIKLRIRVFKTKITNWLLWRGHGDPVTPNPNPYRDQNHKSFLSLRFSFSTRRRSTSRSSSNLRKFKNIHFHVPSINRSMMSIIDWAYD